MDLEKSPHLFSSKNFQEAEYTCHECAWDKAFSDSVDYTDKMFIEEKNEILSDAIEFTEEIEKNLTQLILIYGAGSWECIICKAIRLNEENSRIIGKPEEIIKILKKPCDSCHSVGKLRYRW